MSLASDLVYNGIAYLRLYTNPEIDLSQGLEIFNMLEGNGLTDDLLARIPEKELAAP